MRKAAPPLTPFAREEYTRQIAFRSGSPPPTTGSEATRTAYLKRHVLLPPGREEENFFPSIRGPGGAVEFFRERKIAWWSPNDDKARPPGHLASSQIAVLNFLLPLALGHADALTALLQELDEDVVEIVPIEHEGRRTLVEFEWVGVPGPLERGAFVRGEKCTSVDALLLGRTVKGAIRGYFIEWKYTERCGESLAPGQNSTRQRCYSGLYRASSLFRPPLVSLFHDPVYQLVRSLLLGFRTVRNRELGVTEARTIVVCPDANESYRVLPAEHALGAGQPVSVGDLMRERVLAVPGRFCVVSQRRLLDRIFASGASTPEGWADYHRIRYAWR